MTARIQSYIDSAIDQLMRYARDPGCTDEAIDQGADVLGDWIAANAHKEDNWQVIFRLGDPWP